MPNRPAIVQMLAVATALAAVLCTTQVAAAAGTRVWQPTLLTSKVWDAFLPSRSGNPVNGAGLVAGSVVLNDRHRAAVFNPSTGAIDVLEGLGTDCQTWAVDINVHNHVAGYRECESNRQVGFLWSAGSAVRFLAGPDVTTWPEALNDRDVVVGRYSSLVPPSSAGFVWSPASGALQLLSGPGATVTDAADVNNGGYVVGTVDDRYGRWPYLWVPRTNTLVRISAPLVGGGSSATGINDRGYVVGDDSVNQSWVWSPVTRTVSTLAGYGQAQAISPGGVVVGSGGVNTDALVWDTCDSPPQTQPAPPSPVDQPLSRVDGYAYGVNIYGRVVGELWFRGENFGVLSIDGASWDLPGKRTALRLDCRS